MKTFKEETIKIQLLITGAPAVGKTHLMANFTE